MSTDDFRDLVEEFRNDPATFGIDPGDVVNLSFQRWSGATIVNGIAQDSGFAPLVVGPEYAFFPRAPKKMLERLAAGDRERDVCLIWTFSRDFAGLPLNVLNTIEQVGHTRADRLVDNDRGLTYIIAVQWDYGRQARISGALGTLLDVS